ncbi:MAG: hypothetical protein J6U68_02725, partial [Clostridia bacterium]|nr:hypothetical protein [Clostridia bacterium]
MIESREQRKKSSLLRRRKVIIIVSVLLVIALGISLYFVYDYVNNSIPYVDVDGKTYYIKQNDDGIWQMYYKDGGIVTRESQFNYYALDSGTLVSIDETTGEALEKIVLDPEEGELQGGYGKILIFKHIEKDNLRSIEVHNQLDDYTFYRYNIETMRPDDSSDFVLRGSPLLTTTKDVISQLIVAAGYPLAAERLDEPATVDGKIDFSEYGLTPEKRTKIEVDKDGNEQTVEYDYTPSYYIVTSKSGEKFKMVIGDRLVNGNGYYAQYVDISGDVETPREKVYVLSTDAQTLLYEAKKFITPGIAYPVTQSDYFDVTDFTVSSKDKNGVLKKKVAFNYVDLDDRTGTVLGSRPYVFADERSQSYDPNYDRIDVCLQAFMDPTIVDIAVLSPTPAERAEYGLMKAVLDENGNHVLDSKGQPKYVYDSQHVVSFKRTATDDSNNKVNFLQTVYISDKNENGNYYSYTTLEFLDDVESSSVTGITFDMICEVSAETFNFLTFDEYQWVYHKFLETGLAYTTALTIKTADYSASFKVNNTKDGDDYATQITGENSLGKTADTFGMLKFVGADGNNWYISQYEVKVYAPNGEEMA